MQGFFYLLYLFILKIQPLGSYQLVSIFSWVTFFFLLSCDMQWRPFLTIYSKELRNILSVQMMSQYVQWDCTSADQVSAAQKHDSNKKTPSFISPQNKSSAISPKCEISLDFLCGYFTLFKEEGAALVLCKAMLRQNCRAEKKWKILCKLFIDYFALSNLGPCGQEKGHGRSVLLETGLWEGKRRAAWQDIPSWKHLIWYHNKNKW